jgi:hypothetical protein
VDRKIAMTLESPALPIVEQHNITVLSQADILLEDGYAAGGAFGLATALQTGT